MNSLVTNPSKVNTLPTLSQAILRKMLVLNLWGYVTNTLYISIILLFAMPLAMYGLIKLIDNIDKQRGHKSVKEYLFGG